MRYIHKTLLDDEQVVYMAHPHWIVFAPTLVCILVTILMAMYGYNNPIFTPRVSNYSFYSITLILLSGVSFIVWLKAYIFYRCSEFGVTNKRVLMKTGWIQRDSLEMFLDKVEAMHVDQSVMGRVLGYGSLIVIGTGGSRDPFTNVPRPLHFRKMVQQEIDDYVESHYRRTF